MKFASMLAAALVSLVTSTTTVPVSVATQHCISIMRTLSYGSTGADVSKLQTFLNVKSTGYFGGITQSALIKWQMNSHIIASAKSSGAGVVGPKTRVALACAPLPANSPVPKPVSVSIVPTVVTSTTSISTTSTPASPSTPMSSGGGSGASPTVVQQCPAFTTPQPPASQCKWQWQLIEDEAGCPAEWDCSDPNATQ